CPLALRFVLAMVSPGSLHAAALARALHVLAEQAVFLVGIAPRLLELADGGRFQLGKLHVAKAGDVPLEDSLGDVDRAVQRRSQTRLGEWSQGLGEFRKGPREVDARPFVLGVGRVRARAARTCLLQASDGRS